MSLLEDYEQDAHHLAGPEVLEEQWQEPEELDWQVVVYLVEEARLVGYYLCLKHPFRYQLPEGERRAKNSRRQQKRSECNMGNGACPKRETTRNVLLHTQLAQFFVASTSSAITPSSTAVPLPTPKFGIDVFMLCRLGFFIIRL